MRAGLAISVAAIAPVFVLALALALACAATTGCGGTVKRPDGGSGLLPVGAPAPDLFARDVDRNEVRLSTLKGKPVVVYFYPADSSPGCTKEACAFRDAWMRYEEARVAVIGVSSDGTTSHEKFMREHHLPFPLAADPNGDIAWKYGVPKHIWGYYRVTFLVDREGKIAHVWPDVDPGVHADQVLSEASKL